MPAEQSLRNGDLQEALRQLQDQVRADPADPKLRVFLFQLLAINGDWNRALTQLNVSGDLDDGNLAMVHMYREALACEALRKEIFAGERAPLILGEPDQWVAQLFEALKLVAGGRYPEAARLRDEAFEAAPQTSGTLNGRLFEWIADADSRLGPVLEVILDGKYYWVPFHRIAAIHLDEPADLHDIVWLPAQLRWANGGETVALIPTRYPGSDVSEDDAIRLARRSEWIERPEGTYFGLGQRMLVTDSGEFPLMEVRDVALEAPAEQLGAAGEPPGARGRDA